MGRESVRGIIEIGDKLVTIFRRKKDEEGNVKEYYVIPGGGMEPGESEVDTLIRELHEELNIKVLVGKKLFTVKTEYTTEHFYECTYISGDLEIVGEEKDRNCESNFYEIFLLPIKEIDKYEIREEVKRFFSIK